MERSWEKKNSSSYDFNKAWYVVLVFKISGGREAEIEI